jgi:hypothetical protein
VEALAAALPNGVAPVEYMLSILHDPNSDEKAKAWAAEKAAPFVHPKPAPAQRLVKIDLPATDTAEGVSAALGRLIQAVAAGDLAPSEAQAVATLIEAQRKAIETGDLVKRMEALEARQRAPLSYQD